jgi:hypothetical protein
MDYLILGNYLLSKDEQTNITSDDAWMKDYELD